MSENAPCSRLVGTLCVAIVFLISSAMMTLIAEAQTRRAPDRPPDYSGRFYYQKVFRNIMCIRAPCPRTVEFLLDADGETIRDKPNPKPRNPDRKMPIPPPPPGPSIVWLSNIDPPPGFVAKPPEYHPAERDNLPERFGKTIEFRPGLGDIWVEGSTKYVAPWREVGEN